MGPLLNFLFLYNSDVGGGQHSLPRFDRLKTDFNPHLVHFLGEVSERKFLLNNCFVHPEFLETSKRPMWSLERGNLWPQNLMATRFILKQKKSCRNQTLPKQVRCGLENKADSRCVSGKHGKIHMAWSLLHPFIQHCQQEAPHLPANPLFGYLALEGHAAKRS